MQQWVHYDEEFRARLSEDANGQWGQLDNDLYMHMMNAEKFSKTTFTASGLPIIHRPFQGHPTHSGVGAGGRGQGTTGGGSACWSFNKGICTCEYCKFRHECSKCGGRHPLVQCWGASHGGPHVAGTGGTTHQQRGARGAHSTVAKGSYAS